MQIVKPLTLASAIARFFPQTPFVLLAGMALSAVPSFSQAEGTGRNEVAVQAIGSFVKTTTSDGVEQSATKTGGVLASYRLFLTNNHGVEINYGYSLNTQGYRLGGSQFGVNSYSHEASAAYVFRYPLKRWTPFVLAGAGALVFDPRDAAGIPTQARAAFVYGGGADITLSRHLFVRAEYRGFVYNSPTFEAQTVKGFDRVTHRAEPSLGFGYRF